MTLAFPLRTSGPRRQAVFARQFSPGSFHLAAYAMPAPTKVETTRPPLFPAVAPAILALADGTVFRGRSIGARSTSVGEVVFNTSMTGYQEILTDPDRKSTRLNSSHLGISYA